MRSPPWTYPERCPGFAQTAGAEGLEEVAEWLETLARAEKSHAGRFIQGLESGSVAPGSYAVVKGTP